MRWLAKFLKTESLSLESCKETEPALMHCDLKEMRTGKKPREIGPLGRERGEDLKREIVLKGHNAAEKLSNERNKQDFRICNLGCHFLPLVWSTGVDVCLQAVKHWHRKKETV